MADNEIIPPLEERVANAERYFGSKVPGSDSISTPETGSNRFDQQVRARLQKVPRAPFTPEPEGTGPSVQDQLRALFRNSQ